ncbi:MAG TPA: chromate transporter [Candidatus Acidoferrales bacterium]|nr:chromate transporter [Candidatus Acidoferrales bacterium]
MFAPVYLVIVVLAPYFRRQFRTRAFVQGVTAAATGAIAGAAVVLARRALIDVWTLGIGALTLAVLMRWKISELRMIAVAAALGLWLRG